MAASSGRCPDDLPAPADSISGSKWELRPGIADVRLEEQAERLWLQCDALPPKLPAGGSSHVLGILHIPQAQAEQEEQQLAVCLPGACLRTGRSGALWRLLLRWVAARFVGELPGNSSQLELLLPGQPKYSAGIIVHSRPNEDCGDRGLLLENEDRLPRFFVGAECVEGASAEGQCMTSWQHLEVSPAHPAAKCCAALARTPAKVTGEGSDGRVLSMLRECQRQHRRAYWLLQIGTLNREARAIRPPDVLSSQLLCVPEECDEDAAGAWLTEIAVVARVSVRVDSASFFLTSERTLHSLASWCRPGRLRLPTRRAWRLANVGRLPDQLFHIMWATADLPPQKMAVLVAEQPLPRRLPAPLPLAKAPSGAAVLFAGAWRFSPRVAEDVRRRLVEPLGAAVFAVLSGPAAGAGAAERAAFLRAFGPAVADFAWARDPGPGALREELLGGRGGGRQSLYEAMGGLILTPLSGNGTTLHSFRKMQAGLELVERYEEARGQRFRWIIHSRTDLLWQADHPPLHLLEEGPASDSTVWIPQTRRHDSDGKDGLCDWHAVVPRSLAGVYFGRWRLLQEGLAPAVRNQNPHVFLRNVLALHGARVGRFPAVMGVERCVTWTCFGFGWWSGRGRGAWRWPEEWREVMRIAPGLERGWLAWERAGAGESGGGGEGNEGGAGPPRLRVVRRALLANATRGAS